MALEEKSQISPGNSLPALICKIDTPRNLR